MNGQTWQGMVTRASVVAEGAYHASEAAALHEAARVIALCLLLLLLCHHGEGLALKWLEKRGRKH
jgi:hypothetical protein